ncbi:MAG TPA: hypothetical protein VJ728_14375 [Candidatus Binataceae bacterium]|nr:hypothetical protein [Candidatus Binataceae bacterium]
MTISEVDGVNRGCEPNGLGFFTGSLMATLALLLFTHIVLCPPTYDDDVCAGARIDKAAHFALDTVVELSKADGRDGAKLISVQLPDARIAIESDAVFPAVGVRVRTVDALSNTALAHRRTIVLLI